MDSSLLAEPKCIIKKPDATRDFHSGKQPRRVTGALIDADRKVVDLQAATAAPAMAARRARHHARHRTAGDAALDTIGQLSKPRSPRSRLRRKKCGLLAPIPVPPQMRDFLCFEKHLLQAFKAIGRTPPQAWYERPIFYHPSRFSVCGTDDRRARGRPYCETLDFELEFGCYIGKPGKDIPKERAREHIFGYTIFNDFSARDEQSKEMAGQLGPGKGKDFDNGNPMGPVPRDRRRDRRPLPAGDDLPRQRRGVGPRQLARHEVDLRGLHRARLALRDAARRRILRFRDCWQWLRAGKYRDS